MILLGNIIYKKIGYIIYGDGYYDNTNIIEEYKKLTLEYINPNVFGKITTNFYKKIGKCNCEDIIDNNKQKELCKFHRCCIICNKIDTYNISLNTYKTEFINISKIDNLCNRCINSCKNYEKYILNRIDKEKDNLKQIKFIIKRAEKDNIKGYYNYYNNYYKNKYKIIDNFDNNSYNFYDNKINVYLE